MTTIPSESQSWTTSCWSRVIPNVKPILSTQAIDFDISATRSNAFMPLLGEGIFTSRGAKWKHSRALVLPQFSHEQVSNLTLMDRHVKILLDILKTDDSGWTLSMDVQPLFFRFTLDTATEFLYEQISALAERKCIPRNPFQRHWRCSVQP